ncbi:MAG TPA: caspase family protein [Thermoanaerobaculia bacterium]|jgi:hypothetical protein
MKMRAAKPFILGIGAIAIAAATYVHTVANRGAEVLFEPATVPAEGKFNRSQSVGLFVGVRKFTEDAAIDVPYAVDDAVDLAHMFSLGRASLLPPQRVVLALAGNPQKEDSQKRLRELRNAGAMVRKATSEDILDLLEQQSERVGKDGILIFSLATHGFIDQESRKSYILGSNSRFERIGTALPLEELIDIAAESNARRSLLFVDACRDRFRTTGTRSVNPDPRSVAPPIENRMSRIHGQVVFYAAPAGKYAYDDALHKNGVFTRAVLNGLSCEASMVDGWITAKKLHEYVNQEVKEWVRKHREPNRDIGIQVNVEGRTDNMPLAACACPPCTPFGPTSVSTAGSKITALDELGKPLWSRDVSGAIEEAKVADLDIDGAREVVVQVGGKILNFDARGEQSWEAGSGITRFLTGVLRKYKEEIVAQTGETQLSVFDSAGKMMWQFHVRESLKDFKIGRASNLHDWRIVAATANHLTLFNPKKGTRVCDRRVPAPIESFQFIDANNDGKLDIALKTATGKTYVYDFYGKPLN